MNRVGFRIGFALIAVGILSIGLSRFRRADVESPSVEAYGQVPDFTLVDSHERPLSLADLKGHVWVADFIFTSCAGMCPMMTGEMRKLQDALPGEIRLVSFSVDPSRDTPEVLRSYASRYGADQHRWFFVTGERQALYDLSIKGFKLGVDDAQGTPSEPITHSSRFVLIGKDAQIRGYYSGTDSDELRRLAEDARKLL